MSQIFVADALIRKIPKGGEEIVYHVVTVTADSRREIADAVMIEVATRNTIAGTTEWELIGIGSAGCYDEWMRERESWEEYWGEY